MARPVKWRRVEHIPKFRYFKPAGIERIKLEENILKIEEMEAIRLRDLEELEQEECAKSMEISRQTFQRVYNSAKKKVADSLINGKAIKVEGGHYTQNICNLTCKKCGFIWRERVEELDEKEKSCPKCGAKGYDCIEEEVTSFCGRKCRKRRGK